MTTVTKIILDSLPPKVFLICCLFWFFLFLSNFNKRIIRLKYIALIHIFNLNHLKYLYIHRDIFEIEKLLVEINMFQRVCPIIKFFLK